MESAFLSEVSRKIKDRRLYKRLTLQELADKSGVTKGLISQIENGRSIPSVPVLFNIIESLEFEVSDFFEGLKFSKPLLLIRRKEEYESFEREYALGFSYQRVLNKGVSASAIDIVLLEIHPNSSQKEVVTEAIAYKYILSGEIDYQMNGETYTLRAGDSLLFDGRIPHFPVNTKAESCRLLIVYFFNHKN